LNVSYNEIRIPRVVLIIITVIRALTDNDNDNTFMYYSDGARGIAQQSNAQASATAMQIVGRLEGPTVATFRVKVLNGTK
jgi:hypothetical protein